MFFEVDQTWKIRQQISAAIKLMPFLSLREWSLFTPNSDAPDFICSDSPVCVTSSNGKIGHSVGFCERQSVVTIPLGRRHALAGFFEGSKDLMLSMSEVGGFNLMTTTNSRYVFSATQEVTILSDND